MPLLTVKAQIHIDPQAETVLKDAMSCATKVYNGLLWRLRQEYEQTGRAEISRKNLNRILKELPRAKGYYSMSVQLTRDEVRQAYRAFFALREKGADPAPLSPLQKEKLSFAIKYVQSGFKVEGDEVTLSLGTSGEDGVRQVSFRISHKPGIEFNYVREISIIYDKFSGRLEARLVVEVKAHEVPGTGQASVDLGETVLLAAVFSDGTGLLYSGKLIKAIRHYWQKVRCKVKPPSKEHSRMSRRYREIAHKESRQVNQLLHLITSHFIRECIRHGVKEIATGNFTGIREQIDYGSRMNQRLHAWPYRKVAWMIRYKAEIAGVTVQETNERNTSRTCHACGRILSASRVHRGLYRCACGWSLT